MSYASMARFGDYGPASFGWGARDPEQNPALLKPFTFDGVPFGPMHVDVHGLFSALLAELVPHIPGGLVNGQCGCYNPQSVTVGGTRSFHTYAIAIDVNWGSNPMYAKTRPTGKFALPPATSQIARKYGCEWGGDWSYPQDWMHIECHLTPEVARSVRPVSDTEEFTVDAEAKAEFAKLYNLLHSALSPVGSDGKPHQVSVDTIIARRTSPILSAAAANKALVSALGTRVAELQRDHDALTKQLAAMQQQLADIAAGKVTVSGEIPATLKIGG